MFSRIPRRAAAPPGLHMQPVRKEIFRRDAEYSMNEFGNISPVGCNEYSSISGTRDIPKPVNLLRGKQVRPLIQYPLALQLNVACERVSVT